MTYYEGILVSWDRYLNVSAAGGEISEDKIELSIYTPSDTARNLGPKSRFTFSLTDSAELFYRAALTGHNEPSIREVPISELQKKEDFYYPKGAVEVHLCVVKEVYKKNTQDEYGESVVKNISGEIVSVEKIGESEPLDRGDPVVDALVHATRLDIADHDKKEELVKKIQSILENAEIGPGLHKKISEYIEKEEV